MDESEIGRLYKEQMALSKEVKRLESKLWPFAKALQVLTQPGGNIHHEESRTVVDGYDSDPREDWRKLKDGILRLHEITRSLPK